MSEIGFCPECPFAGVLPVARVESDTFCVLACPDCGTEQIALAGMDAGPGGTEAPPDAPRPG